ncbi:TIGR03960 family B12-binding radical SAM protein [Alkaliphilus serpentinus]|uniref:TIGR03960 family B12-binding radical SAM protein n=1 Tax=Alkaliphilus serpentinus TaxID=1482731 RepID=A0A833HPZ9_9FIRM|nr:TIGR03960 family B12-binding radical SAM protein [Alkaliphilus serpentinus]KAB3531433.1 TIGR03960 family B12-binding radical SAM protein [Alkaliphilus serpentinus]
MKRVDIEDILYTVEKPGRYLGNELNSVHKTVDENTIRFAFCFPDIYEIGMSHLGMQILYFFLNKQENVFCERVFAPATDMEDRMRRSNIPLFGLESRESIEEFDFVGFTLQYELSYTNILNMLNLARIPLFSKDRGEKHPYIIVGGPCAYNPEPIADFVDIVILGEAEEVLPEVLEVYEKYKGRHYKREDFLIEVSSIQGVYIPSLYTVEYNLDGTLKAVKPKYEGVPERVQKRIIEDMDEVFYPDKIIVPFIDTVHDRVMLEVFRGCTRGCRFCQAGMIYRPIREKGLERLQELSKSLLKNTGYEEISLASLSTSDFSNLDKLVRHLISEYEKDRVGISLPSLRLDNITFEIMEEVQKIRKSGLTFAPEAGSQRLRDVINKGITEEDLRNAVEKAFSLGWSSVKLYFMIGLPTETNEDLVGIKELAYMVVDCYHRTDKEKRGKGLNVTVSASNFVPKPFTPFQWVPQNSLEEINKKQKTLVDELRHKKITFNYHDAKTSFLEGVFARGDRRLSKVLAHAIEEGCKFDGWGEHFNFDRWMRVFEETAVDPSFYANRSRNYEEILPWDHIDVGVTKEFLIRENEKAKEGKLTVDCRTNCSGCGINQGFIGGVC